ncbi:MAG: hypothetical protein HPY45_05370 [Anaerolineae bacterium]|nr:hypothetical protein [Anaerolineae bacterium]
MRRPLWISTPDDLHRVVPHLARCQLLGVDTESNGLHAYREQVCLIQISTEDDDYLIDPLALNDLSPLGGLFADPRIEKVFHAAEYDLICLKRDFGFLFVNLFDTMLAGRILGRSATGLGAMLEWEFGITVDKHCQRADWRQRPLPHQLITYAQMDTHYLIPLRHQLREELIQCGRLQLAEEDFRRMCLTQVPKGNNGENGFWRVAGGHTISPMQASVLQQLYDYRERVARMEDRPVFKVLSNQTLLQIAKTCPQKTTDLAQVCRLTSRQISMHGRQLLEAVSRGLSSKPLQRPASPRRDDDVLHRMDVLRSWRKAVARQMGVESDVVLPREILERIARQFPQNAQELEVLMEHTPWRFKHYGAQILQALGVEED